MVEKQFDATRYRAAVDLFYIHMGIKMVIEKVFIIGAGLMGGGIAQVCAQAGQQVSITDVSSEAVDKALKNIAWSVGKLVEKGKLTDSAKEILSRISQVQE